MNIELHNNKHDSAKAFNGLVCIAVCKLKYLQTQIAVEEDRKGGKNLMAATGEGKQRGDNRKKTATKIQHQGIKGS